MSITLFEDSPSLYKWNFLKLLSPILLATSTLSSLFQEVGRGWAPAATGSQYLVMIMLIFPPALLVFRYRMGCKMAVPEMDMPFPTDCLGFTRAMNTSSLCLHHWFLVTNSGATGNISVNKPDQISHLVCLFDDKAWCCADCHKCLLNESMR